MMSCPFSISRSSQLTTADLQELLDAGAVENIRLEFKREDPKKPEMLKKLSSFGNTFGGFLIVGAEEGEKGKLAGFPGIEVQNDYKQRIVLWCAHDLYPPLQVDVSEPVPAPGSSTGRVCYVILVDDSDTAPHFINNRGGVYVRVNERSKGVQPELANETEIRHLLNQRELVLRRRADLIARAKERFEAFLQAGDAIRQEGGEERRMDYARLMISIMPRFPVRPVVEHLRLLEIVRSQYEPWRQVGFPPMPGEALSQHESAIVLDRRDDELLEVNVWGQISYAWVISERIERDPYCSQDIHMDRFLGHLLVYLRYSHLLLAAIGYAGPLRAQLRLQGIRGVSWRFYRHSQPFRGPSSLLDDRVSIDFDWDSTELAGDRIDAQCLRHIFLATNWDRRADGDGIERLLSDGYEYNMWTRRP